MNILLAATLSAGLALANAEFEKYHEKITGRKPAPGTIAFSVDPKVSKTGNDAYVIKSGKVGRWSGEEVRGVRIVGSNERSVLYAVYDLLERKGGCRWFWDGDVVPKKDALDLSGLDVREESQFCYRGIRYFAHRGLTRFQCEQWGPEDWKREIDWCVKNRLNLMMLRIGFDDVFQKAFPDVVPYPDPSKPLPEAQPGYDNRSLFWSLEYRGRLRKRLQEYAFARGMMIPEDFGTMTHWYSRTPRAFLDKMKPKFLGQVSAEYGEDTGLVWDIQADNGKWMDAYWKLTETSLREYGRPGLLHTIGTAERRLSTNRYEQITMKIDSYRRLLAYARKRQPGTKFLLAGWDFWATWKPDEMRRLLAALDPSDTVIFDYEADARDDDRSFTSWGVVGQFPYTFGIFESFESALDPRADYALLERRQKAIENDPKCVGYLYWPESSHVDAFMLRYFPLNAWRTGGKTFDSLLPDFCRDRYGKDAARMEKLWREIQPIVRSGRWGGNWANSFDNVYGSVVDLDDDLNVFTGRFSRVRMDYAKNFPYARVKPLLRSLAAADFSSEFVRRDATDLARTLADRYAMALYDRILNRWSDWRKGDDAAAKEIRSLAGEYLAAGELMAAILASHEDYSLAESLRRLDAVEKIRNPGFEHVLVDNAVNFYCRSHQYETAEWLCLPQMRHLAELLEARLGANDRSPLDVKAFNARFEKLRQDMIARPLVLLDNRASRPADQWKKLVAAHCAGE